MSAGRAEGPGKVSTADGPADIGSMAVASSSIAALTLVSRITGFVRGAVIAAVLGPTFFGNLFLVTNSLPNLLYEFAIGSLLVSLLVPHLVAQLDSGEPDRAARTANGLLGTLCVVFFVVAVIVVAAGPIVLRVLGAGIDDPVQVAEQRRVGWPLLVLVIPQAVLYALIGTSSAVQNAHGRFALSAAAPIAENLGTMAVFIGFWLRWGTGLDLVDVTSAQLMFLGIGATGAVALHAAVQWWGAWRVGHVFIPTAGWRDPDVRSILRLALSSFGYAAFNSARYLIVLIAAGSVPGGVVAYQLALNFRDLPNALITRPFSITTLPSLSRHSERRDWTSFLEIYRSTVRLSAVLLMLASTGLVVLAVPISRSFAFGSMDSTTGRALLAAALGTMTLGIVGDGVFVMATNAAYAMRDATRPLRAMGFRTIVTAIGVGLAMFTSGTTTLVIVGLTIAFADNLAGFALNHAIVGRIKPDTPAKSVRSWPAILASGLISGTAGALMLAAIDPGADASRLRHLLTLGAGAAVVLAVYAGVARDTGLLDASTIGRALSERLQPGDARTDGPEKSTTTGWALRSVLATSAVATGAIGIGLLAAAVGPLLIAGVAAIGLLMGVAARPSLAAYLWLGTAPLIVGVDRGTVVPLLRLNEALLALLAAGVLVRAAIAPRAVARLESSDAAVVALVAAGSVVPLLVMMGRTGGFTMDDALSTAPLIKLGVLYAVIRVAVREANEVRTAITIALASVSVAALIGFLQTLGLFGVRSFLASGLFVTGDDATRVVAAGRGTSTVGNAIGASGLYLGALFVALAWYRRPNAPRRFLVVSVMALVVGIGGTAQFTAVVGLVTGVIALKFLQTRSDDAPASGARSHRAPLGLRLAGVALALASGLVAFGPRLALLAQGDVPQSWTARWDNLSTHFLSRIGLDSSLLFGVSPITQVRDPRGYVEWIWIESGYVQLVFSGGLILLLAFALLMLTQLGSAWTSKDLDDEFGVVGAATWAMGVTLCVLMLLDPHLSMRGTSDLVFPLLAMSTTAFASARPAVVSLDRRRRIQQLEPGVLP